MNIIVDDYGLVVAVMFHEIKICNNYLQLKRYKNIMLFKLLNLDNEDPEDIISYWEVMIESPRVIKNYEYECNVIRDIIESYYRTIITDNWADEVGEKYYY